MPDTARTLRAAAYNLTYFGLWTGANFALDGGGLSITAAIYRAVTGATPNAFLDDENTSLRLIHANTHVMDAVAFLSSCLDTQPPSDQATALPDHIEHIERYAAEPPPGATQPPTASEVIGRILRAANTADTLAGRLPRLRLTA
ncbi:hypothetical protein [Streptomyces sp.]|uniref:hypothetical protein n=1 Tax=Streptomyces sp. TaxID=1931 RepID=UPI002F3F0937